MTIRQNTPEWLQMRKEKVGASDAPVIMEVSPWKTPYQLWQDKLSTTVPTQNYAMMRGHEMEPVARAAFEKTMDLLVTPMVKIHPKHEWMMASLDGVDPSGEHIVEIKCAGKDDHALAVSGQIPQKYYPQLQHQLEVCQLERAYYFSFDGFNGVVVMVHRDEKYIKEMISKEQEFLECVNEFNPPKLTERDYVQKNDQSWLDIALKWRSINQQMQLLEKQEKSMREQLISLSENQNCIGGGIKISKSIRKGTVDYTKIPEFINVNLDDYRKSPVEYWKIISN